MQRRGGYGGSAIASWRDGEAAAKSRRPCLAGRRLRTDPQAAAAPTANAPPTPGTPPTPQHRTPDESPTSAAPPEPDTPGTPGASSRDSQAPSHTPTSPRPPRYGTHVATSTRHVTSRRYGGEPPGTPRPRRPNPHRDPQGAAPHNPNTSTAHPAADETGPATTSRPPPHAPRSPDTDTPTPAAHAPAAAQHPSPPSRSRSPRQRP